MEWKSQLPSRDLAARTLCAFANGVGGKLLVGVGDAGEVLGVSDSHGVCEDLRRAATDDLLPAVRVRCRIIDVAGLSVIEATIPAVEAGPVALRLPDGSTAVYVREGSSSRPAGPDEVKALAKRRRARIDDDGRRLLLSLRGGPRRASELARAARLGSRAAKRGVVRLCQAGMVLEKQDGRLWITPAGHQRLGGST